MTDFTLRLAVRSAGGGRDFRLYLGGSGQAVTVAGAAVSPASVASGAVTVQRSPVVVSGSAISPASIASGTISVQTTAITVGGSAVSPASVAGGSVAVQRQPINVSGAAVSPASVASGTIAVQRAPILVGGAAVSPASVAYGHATIYRILSAHGRAVWGAQSPLSAVQRARWPAMAPTVAILAARGPQLVALFRLQAVLWGGMTDASRLARVAWGGHRALMTAPVRARWSAMESASTHGRGGWGTVVAMPTPPWRAPWSGLANTGVAGIGGWDSLATARTTPTRVRWPTMLAPWTQWRVPWGGLQSPPWRWPRKPAPQEPPVITPAPADRFRLYLRPRTPPAGRDFRLYLGGPYYLTTQRTWRVLIRLSAYRFFDSLPLALSSVTLRADRDSYGWEATITTSDRAVIDALFLIDPPASLAVIICGHLVLLQPETWRASLKFGDAQYTITANSRTALLDAPFAVATGGSNATSLTAQQLCEAILDGTGFTLQWDCPVDWPIPAGRHTWSNATPKTRIRAIADAVGATLQSALSSDTLIVTPRYPLAPWEWAGQTPALVLSGMIRSAALGVAQSMAYDCVYVSGTDTGALSWVKLAGTQGERPMPGVTDAYLTTGDANRERGRQVLAAAANQKSFGVVIGIDQYPNPPGIVTPGTLVELIVDGAHWLDLVISCQIECKFGSVTQTLGFGEGRGNAYARFRNLLPTDPLLTGTVVAVWEDGTATVELPGGAEIRVKGSATVGQRVFVQTGAIQGEAPALTALTVEV